MKEACVQKLVFAFIVYGLKVKLPENEGINSCFIEPGWAFEALMCVNHPAQCLRAGKATAASPWVAPLLLSRPQPLLTAPKRHQPPPPKPRLPAIPPPCHSTCYCLGSDPHPHFISCIANSFSLFQGQVPILGVYHPPTRILSSGLGSIPWPLCDLRVGKSASSTSMDDSWLWRSPPKVIFSVISIAVLLFLPSAWLSFLYSSSGEQVTTWQIAYLTVLTYCFPFILEQRHPPDGSSVCLVTAASPGPSWVPAD